MVTLTVDYELVAEVDGVCLVLLTYFINKIICREAFVLCR